MSNSRFQILVSNYYATGEGQTISMLITCAYPCAEDYKKEPHFDENFYYYPGELATTAAERAEREFCQEFGHFLSLGADNLGSEQFLDKFSNYIPHNVKDILLRELKGRETPGNFNFKQKVHINHL